MLLDLVRFYREAPLDAAGLGATSLDDYLDSANYSTAFRDDHLFPMAAAICRRRRLTSAGIRGRLHPLLRNPRASQAVQPPVWRTVEGGSRSYVQRLATAISNIVPGLSIKSIARQHGGIVAMGEDGGAVVSTTSSLQRMPTRRSACLPIRAPMSGGCLARSATQQRCLPSLRHSPDAAPAQGVVELELPVASSVPASNWR